MEYCTVIELFDGAINNVYLFSGTTDREAKTKANKKFIDLCEEHIENFDDYTEKERLFILADGRISNAHHDFSIWWPIKEKN